MGKSKTLTEIVFYYPARRADSQSDFVAFGVTVEPEDDYNFSAQGLFLTKPNGNTIVVRPEYLWYETTKREIVLDAPVEPRAVGTSDGGMNFR